VLLFFLLVIFHHPWWLAIVSLVLYGLLAFIVLRIELHPK